MMVSNGNYQAWLDCWSSFRRRTHWSRNHRLRNGFWMSLLNIAASLCSNCPGTDWLPRRLLPLLCRRLTTFLGSLNPDRRRTNPRHLDTLQLSSSSDRSGNVPVCAFAACIMPTHLRFRRRSFLGLLFLFSLSTSVLYFIYSAPGIGKSSEAIIGNIPTVWGCLCGLWVMCDSSACCHWEWRRAKEPCVSAELRAPFPVISTYLTTVITVRLISIMATTMLMFVGLTAMIVTLVRRATTGSTGGMLFFFVLFIVCFELMLVYVTSCTTVFFGWTVRRSRYKSRIRRPQVICDSRAEITETQVTHDIIWSHMHMSPNPLMCLIIIIITPFSFYSHWMCESEHLPLLEAF